MATNTLEQFTSFEELPECTNAFVHTKVMQLPVTGPLLDVVGLSAHSNLPYEIMLLGSTQRLLSQASVVFCGALALLGRTEAAVRFLGVAIEEEPDPASRQILLCALSQVCQISGQNFQAPAREAATERILGDFRASANADLPSRLPSVAPYEQVKAYRNAGGKVAPYSYSASCQRDRYWATQLEAGGQNMETLLIEAVEEFGPWREIARAASGKAGRAWGHRAEELCDQELGRIACSAPKESSWMAHEIYESATYSLPAPPLPVVDLLRLIRAKCALAVAKFLGGSPRLSLGLCCEFFSAVDTFRSQVPRLAELTGVLPSDIVTVAMLAVDCLEQGANDGTVTDVPDLEPHLTPEELLTRLVNPKTPFTSLDSALPSLGYPTASLAFPLRKSHYFLCCGHIYRRLAEKSATEVQIEGTSAKIFTQETAIEMARKYIMAAACHPLDDPDLARLYDRVLWSLLLAGGISTKVLWLFFMLRNQAAVNSGLVPVTRNLAVLFDSPARLLPWPNYENGSEALDKLFDLCQFDNGEAHLAPSVIACGGYVFFAQRYHPSAKEFASVGGCIVEPLLRPLLRVANDVFDDCVKLSEEMARLWMAVYHEHHGDLPEYLEGVEELYV